MADSRKLWIPGPAGRLEAALRLAAPVRGAVVLAHPHPLHGGSLDNAVIFHADRELNRAGWTTLRFNFRGVGGSEGVHDDGRGEVDDVGFAASWLRGLAEAAPLVLVGYSFGSWCALEHAVREPSIAGLVAIGLPVRLRPVTDLERLHRPFAVVQGGHDEFGTPDEVRPLVQRADPPGRLRVIEGASHLFAGRARDAASAVVAVLEELALAP